MEATHRRKGQHIRLIKEPAIMLEMERISERFYEGKKKGKTDIFKINGNNSSVANK